MSIHFHIIIMSFAENCHQNQTVEMNFLEYLEHIAHSFIVSYNNSVIYITYSTFCRKVRLVSYCLLPFAGLLKSGPELKE